VPIRIDLNVMMARRNMSLTELSDQVGITMANLSILKNNKARALRLSTLDALCEALDCQPGELIVWEPGEPGEGGG
jgi:putative transcriptional regulator